jgi:hypothetical protein
MSQPGTSMLRSVAKRQRPFGAITEWLIDTDACFDVVAGADGRVLAGDKDPPGMGGDFYGAAWNYTFTEEELQFFTIPTAELTAAWMGVVQTAARTQYASCICMQIDALASPRVLTDKARSDGMVEVHIEIMADPLFNEMVDARRVLSTRHQWGRCNPKGDAPSRSRWASARRLCWQLGQTLVVEAPCEAAIAFKDRVAARLRALRGTDVAAPGGWAIRALLGALAARAAAPLVALCLLVALPLASGLPTQATAAPSTMAWTPVCLATLPWLLVAGVGVMQWRARRAARACLAPDRALAVASPPPSPAPNLARPDDADRPPLVAPQFGTGWIVLIHSIASPDHAYLNGLHGTVGAGGSGERVAVSVRVPGRTALVRILLRPDKLVVADKRFICCVTVGGV